MGKTTVIGDAVQEEDKESEGLKRPIVIGIAGGTGEIDMTLITNEHRISLVSAMFQSTLPLP